MRSGIIAIVLLWAGAIAARPLDLAVPEDGVLASRKIACGSLRPDFVAYAVWKGKVFSRVAWEADRALFDVMGFNVRRCPAVTDPQRGTGYRVVSREIMLFLESGTGRVLETWHNPFTDMDVKVVPIANDPVNLPPVLPRWPDGRPYRFTGEVIGEYVVRNVQSPVFQALPLGADFAAAFGGHSQALEVYTHFVPRSELLNDSQAPLKNLHLAWYRVCRNTPSIASRRRPTTRVPWWASTSISSRSCAPKDERIGGQLTQFRTPDRLGPPVFRASLLFAQAAPGGAFESIDERVIAGGSPRSAVCAKSVQHAVHVRHIEIPAPVVHAFQHRRNSNEGVVEPLKVCVNA